MPRGLLILFLVVTIVFAGMFLVNQTAQLVSLANTVHPKLAQVVLYSLLAVYAAAVIVPGCLLLRFDKPLIPPPDQESAEYQDFLRTLGSRLQRNPLLSSATKIDDRASIESALQILDTKSREVTKQAATRLFVSTAVSQNGRLDAVMVLAEQTRLIWRIAHIYNQRPSISDFVRLYTNVAATLFAANALEDLDVSEQIEPIMKAAVGSAVAGVVPGLSAVTSLILSAILDGTANAYLTLRVGIICQEYCRATTSVDRSKIRKNATLLAAGLLGSIVTGAATGVVRAMLQSATSSVRSAGAKLNPFKQAPQQ